MTKTEKQKINKLAAIFYRLEGYKSPSSYDFSEAQHPHEKARWEFAKMSFYFWKEHFDTKKAKSDD